MTLGKATGNPGCCRFSVIRSGTQDLRPGEFSAVPCGTDQYFDCYPGLASWAIFRRPYGTQFEIVFRGALRRSVEELVLRAFAARYFFKDGEGGPQGLKPGFIQEAFCTA